MRHGSLLAVHARPVPTEKDDDVEVQVCLRRKKLAEAWEVMQSCETDLWTEVCSLYTMVVAVEQDPSKSEGVEYALSEAAEARAVMNQAELLSAVETIEAYKQEEWKQEESSSCVRRGSMLMVHDHHNVESDLEARVRHLEHAEAWLKMKSCEKNLWAAACRWHEEQIKSKIAKREKLDAACWIMQDYNTKIWTSQKVLPKSMNKHAATLTVHAPVVESVTDPAYQAHRQRLIDAWDTMKGAGQKEWLSACKAHEDLLMKGTNIKRKQVRNGVGSHAA